MNLSERVRRTKPDVVVQPVEESTPAPEPKPEVTTQLPDRVKLRVLIGTLYCEEGHFTKGDMFETSRERYAQFDPHYVELVK